MIEKIKKYLFSLRIVRISYKWANKIVLPGFEGMSIFKVIAFFIESFQKGQFGIRSAAISFKFFLALFPMLIFFLSLIPFIPIDNFQEEILIYLQRAVPSNVYGMIDQTVEDLVAQKHHAVLSIGFVLMIYYASNGISTVLQAFGYSYQLEKSQNFIMIRLHSLWLFLLISIFFILALSAIVYSEIVFSDITFQKMDFLPRLLYKIIVWTIMILSMLISISILYNVGNTQKSRWKLFTAGASMSTVLIISVSMLLALYFKNFNKYNELYGSIGSLIMVLIWINSISYILLIGFELSTKTDAHRKEKKLSLEPNLIEDQEK